MGFITAIFFLLIIFLAGAALIAALYGEKIFAEPLLLALVPLAGFGITGFILSWLSMAGIQINAAVLIILAFFSIAIPVLRLRKKRWPVICLREGLPTLRPKALLPALLPVIILMITLQAVSGHAFYTPLYEWDAWALWGLKARVLAAAPLPGNDYFQQVTLSWSHLDYPLSVPFLLQAAAQAAGGQIAETGTYILPVIFLAFVMILFTLSCSKIGWMHAAYLTALIISTPALLRWAGSSTADFPLAAFYLAAVACMLKMHDSDAAPDWRLPALAGFFGACCAFTKNEGMMICMLLFIALLLPGRWPARARVRQALMFAGMCLIFMLPWLIWSRDIPRTHEDYMGQLRPDVIVSNIGRLRIILMELAKRPIMFFKWGGLWCVLALISVLRIQRFRDPAVRFLWFLLITHITGYVVIYIVSPWQPEVLVPMTVDRLLLHVLPVAGLLIAWHLGRQKQQLDPS